MTTPRVTVLMTVYNGMPYLPQAVESVLKQTLTHFEFLIIDDASTDGSSERVRSFKDPRIRLVRNEKNLGQAASLNKGLALIPSEFVARLDQDDVCLPERLMSQVDFLKAHPQAAACGSWLTWIDAQGRPLGVTGFPIQNYGSFLGILLGRATPLAHSTVMFRRRIFEPLGGYDESYAPCEDYELWCRIALRRMSVGIVPRPLLQVRLHDRQQSTTRLAVQREQATRAHERLIAAFCEEEWRPDVGELLRMEPGFWDRQRTRCQVRAVCKEVGTLLFRIRVTLGLSQIEDFHVRKRLSGWLARSVFLGILRQKRESLPVSVLACRLWGWRGIPFALLYLLCFLLSPFFSVVPIRERFARSVWWLNRQRHVARLVWDVWRVR